MRSGCFPLPNVADGHVNLIHMFAELQQFNEGNEWEVQLAVPGHWESSDAIRQLIENHLVEVKDQQLFFVQPGQQDFFRIGMGWMKVRMMNPKPKRRQFPDAILFHIFAKETTGSWDTADSDILSLLEFLDDPDRVEVANLPTLHQTFAALWPLLYPPEPSPSDGPPEIPRREVEEEEEVCWHAHTPHPRPSLT